MSTLTALQLQLGHDCPAPPSRPTLLLQWRIDPLSGRPMAAWTAQRPTAAPSVLPEPAFG